MHRWGEKVPDLGSCAWHLQSVFQSAVPRACPSASPCWVGWLLVPTGCSAHRFACLGAASAFSKEVVKAALWAVPSILDVQIRQRWGSSQARARGGQRWSRGLCLFLLAFWEGFCGRASEYKRVTTAKNNNRTFCQEALSVVLCVSWYPKWQPFVAAWLEIRRVLGFQIKCERALFLHLPCTECCSWSQEGWACLMTELENGRVQEEKVTWNKAWLDITDIFSHSSSASRHDHNLKQARIREALGLFRSSPKSLIVA